MKATKQGTTQGQKRSAERQPAASATKPRSRRPGGQESTPRSRTSEAQPTKAEGLAPSTETHTTKRTSQGAANVAKATAPRRPRRASTEPKPRRTNSRTSGAPRGEAMAKTAPAETPRANVLPMPVDSMARSPVESTFGSAGEGPPSVDTPASPSATLAPPRSLGRQVFETTFSVPLRLLQGVSKSVERVRAAYKQRFGHPLQQSVRALGQLTQRLGRNPG